MAKLDNQIISDNAMNGNANGNGEAGGKGKRGCLSDVVVNGNIMMAWLRYFSCCTCHVKKKSKKKSVCIHGPDLVV